MDANERFEIEAEAFRKATGILPIGKSESPAAVGQSNYTRLEVRTLLWELWCTLRPAEKEKAAIDDGGPAFPQPPWEPGTTPVWDHGMGGMSLRDWLAGQAMCGAMANRARRLVEVDLPGIVKTAYQVADHMLAERKKGRRDEEAKA